VALPTLAVLFQPPPMVEAIPLASFSLPPPTVALPPLAVLSLPPMVEYHPLAVFPYHPPPTVA
jgi:hypothetical protein